MEGGILGINLLQIILHLLNFFILALGLYVLIYKPVVEFMNKRTLHFQELESNTNNALVQAEETLKINNERLANINDEIASIKKQAIKDAEIEANNRIEAAKKEEAQILQRARQAAEFEREKILKDSRDELKNLVINAVDKTNQNGEDVFDAFIDASSNEATYGKN